MPARQVDPARLEGEALTRWYRRSPQEIEQEREGLAKQRYEAYFGDPNSGAATEDLTDLRRQQAEFGRVRRQLDRDNSWLAAGALAPIAVVAGLEGGAVLASRAVIQPIPKTPLNFPQLDAWQVKRGTVQVGRALTAAAKNVLRRAARARFERANGKSASDMQSVVHHSDALEYAHLKPAADPNRLASLWGLRKEAHEIANSAWAEFRAQLKGRVPTQAEYMAEKLRIDRMVEPYIQRPGVSRPGPRPPGRPPGGRSR
jgi:hypothetical protein